jgi:hypothetical protein
MKKLEDEIKKKKSYKLFQIKKIVIKRIKIKSEVKQIERFDAKIKEKETNKKKDHQHQTRDPLTKHFSHAWRGC